ncbi:four helix bundle protein [candidate division Kazan bacterium RIFCSPHIGHO2_01_FULL_44_14]|uniref:Four helix bundle protein n=1 Tax=candidate division Kazan bacterium RIFCSPLOWO2_01_FULL_45_19 TaxID=1798538 RepID=A0A1F4NQS3_UNCK3|nr:hypothetical protein [uncultured bacterium]AQS30212.1 hypothetical protein [uncultured bacterium]OGB73825.1 MAG: four helix bundle protein [candidate division Kazan bacterium RIFCSPLOWO2_01_FULL_45_19]OGB78070.1 MAG: four helix bundle protein [candidate division Kazan bacterium RIFCSPHIGHO2_01_FULL_44_14]
MTILQTNKARAYDLESRTLQFAMTVNNYVGRLPQTVANQENGRQLIRSAGSVGANYIEANEALSKKDFAMRVKISKKEAKESRFWISLTQPSKEEINIREHLINESTELMKILGAILEASLIRV